ncbi:hypothetical protein [uncultured Ruminococcus sp.]|nr:hypothetical protein [uncultured Ruminococcus sp.]
MKPIIYNPCFGQMLCYKLVVRCVHVHRYRDEGINLKFILKFQKLEIRSI